MPKEKRLLETIILLLAGIGIFWLFGHSLQFVCMQQWLSVYDQLGSVWTTYPIGVGERTFSVSRAVNEIGNHSRLQRAFVLQNPVNIKIKLPSLNSADLLRTNHFIRFKDDCFWQFGRQVCATLRNGEFNILRGITRTGVNDASNAYVVGGKMSEILNLKLDGDFFIGLQPEERRLCQVNLWPLRSEKSLPRDFISSFGGLKGVSNHAALPYRNPRITENQKRSDTLKQQLQVILAVCLLIGGFAVLYKTMWCVRFNAPADVNLTAAFIFILLAAGMTVFGSFFLLHVLFPVSLFLFGEQGHVLYSEAATQATMLATILPWSAQRPLQALFSAMNESGKNYSAQNAKRKRLLSSLVS